ncbi:MAG: hypothetical protein IPM27_11390 [Nitrosomonadales bacterium]|nr:hypothetical protein [Nitrosomonadales bacterium]MBK9162135.1 hypothetical protein [Nitrosomonadales bacterium]
MLSNDTLLMNGHQMDQAIERKCLALGINCGDEPGVRKFAHDVLQNIDALRDASCRGDRQARTKVELYGLAMLMHLTNTRAFGPGYMAHFDTLSKHESSWAAVAQAMWRELDARGAADDEMKGSRQ